MIDINYIELAYQLLAHIILQASLFDTLVDRIGIGKALSNILVIDKGCLVRWSWSGRYEIIYVRHLFINCSPLYLRLRIIIIISI